MWDPYADIQKTVLNNGLHIHTAEWPGRAWEILGFLIHAGGRQDPDGLAGIAHLVEHLVTLDIGISLKEIKNFFRNCGGTSKLGTTGITDTRYSFFIPIDMNILKKSLDIFGRMLLREKLTNTIENEKKVVIREYKKKYSYEYEYDFVSAAYSPFIADKRDRHSQVIGHPETLAKITDHNAQAYYARYYCPANISLLAIGGMTKSMVIDSISDSIFADFKKGSREKIPPICSDTAVLEKNRYVVKVSEILNTATNTNTFNFISTAKLPGILKEAAVKIVSRVLHDEIFEEFREKRQWCYSASCSIQNIGDYYRFILSGAAMKPESAGLVEDLAEKIILSLRDNEPLFIREKNILQKSYLLQDLNGKIFLESCQDDLANHDRIIDLSECIEDVNNTTLHDVNQVLEYLRPQFRMNCLLLP